MSKELSHQHRLYYLDALRGIASIIVACFYHYQHFSDTVQSNSTGHIPPFYSFLPFKIFFVRGDLMVDVFFVLSGIVFSHTYRKSIRDQTISGLDFLVRRYSRLYPIHLLTLLTSAGIVFVFYYYFKTYPIYQCNDGFHFVLNFLFLQRGFLDKGYSFNGPAWSLSIEMIMYVLFFFQSKLVKTIPSSFLFVLIGTAFFLSPIQHQFLLNIDVGRGLMGFFSGCLVYELLLEKQHTLYSKMVPATVGIICVIYLGWIERFSKVPLNLMLIVVLIGIIPYLHRSKLIATCSSNRWVRILGDISLSVYLVHAPIQMLIILGYRLSNNLIPYNSSILFLAYCLAVFTGGYVLHYYFEKPIQKTIRAKFYTKFKSHTVKSYKYS